MSEPFWSIHLSYRAADGSAEFAWQRHRLFDRDSAVLLYELCLDDPVATVLSNEGRDRHRMAPAPLSTLEMQKRATQYLRLPGARRLAQKPPS